ncbi:MAG: hypothetical protein ACRDE8_09845 [Ginsengibacter sp.]
MTILFDLDVLDRERMQRLSFEEEKIFETIFNFVFERIKPLENEIDKEEKELDSAENPMCIMIEIIRKRVAFNGYSERLIEKLKQCFNENDSEILALRFDEAFSYLN